MLSFLSECKKKLKSNNTDLRQFPPPTVNLRKEPIKKVNNKNKMEFYLPRALRIYAILLNIKCRVYINAFLFFSN